MTAAATAPRVNEIAAASTAIFFTATDVGLGGWRFWTFNVADSALTIGAALLALLLWRREDADREPAAHAPDADPEASP